MTGSEIASRIKCAREFQRHCLYEESLQELNGVDKAVQDKCVEQEVLKLQSFAYRKLQKYDMAMIYINRAIHCLELNEIPNKQRKYAICLMNKGVIYDVQRRYSDAIREYLKAVNIFRNITEQDGGNDVLINALIDLGIAYINSRQVERAAKILKEALGSFGKDKEKDVRYSYINTMLENLMSDSALEEIK